ncbi:MAG: response regulator transcription factor [Acidobacteria bacterium]|nr:response regulator transcription factor [Acidobacteriota bacterium]
MRILIVEDERAIAELVARGLKEAGYHVEVADSGAEALKRVEAAEHDLLILDLMLPDGSGLELLEKLRLGGTDVPVLILSALGAVDDRVQGLERGADDYLGKPFCFPELLARVRALLRRGQSLAERLQVADLVLDCTRRKATRAGEPIDLAPKEFSVLEFLMRHRGHPMSRTKIVQHVWGTSYDGLTNVVDVYIRLLRSKVDQPWPEKLIRTVRKVGYVIEGEGAPRR